MTYYRRVVKRRSATLTDEEWLQVVERGKLPRPYFRDRDGRDQPPVDVSDLLFGLALERLRGRLEVLCVAFQKPNVQPGQNGASSSTVKIGQLLSGFSEVWGFLTKSAYPGGGQRQPGCLSLKLVPGGLQGTLTDPTSQSFCTLTMESLDDLLLAWEVGLADNSLPWRLSSYGKVKK